MLKKLLLTILACCVFLMGFPNAEAAIDGSNIKHIGPNLSFDLEKIYKTDNAIKARVVAHNDSDETVVICKMNVTFDTGYGQKLWPRWHYTSWCISPHQDASWEFDIKDKPMAVNEKLKSMTIKNYSAYILKKDVHTDIIRIYKKNGQQVFEINTHNHRNYPIRIDRYNIQGVSAKDKNKNILVEGQDLSWNSSDMVNAHGKFRKTLTWNTPIVNQIRTLGWKSHSIDFINLSKTNSNSDRNTSVVKKNLSKTNSGGTKKSSAVKRYGGYRSAEDARVGRRTRQSQGQIDFYRMINGLKPGQW